MGRKDPRTPLRRVLRLGPRSGERDPGALPRLRLPRAVNRRVRHRRRRRRRLCWVGRRRRRLFFRGRDVVLHRRGRSGPFPRGRRRRVPETDIRGPSVEVVVVNVLVVNVLVVNVVVLAGSSSRRRRKRRRRRRERERSRDRRGGPGFGCPRKRAKAGVRHHRQGRRHEDLESSGPRRTGSDAAG